MDTTYNWNLPNSVPQPIPCIFCGIGTDALRGIFEIFAVANCLMYMVFLQVLQSTVTFPAICIYDWSSLHILLNDGFQRRTRSLLNTNKKDFSLGSSLKATNHPGAINGMSSIVFRLPIFVPSISTTILSPPITDCSSSKFWETSSLQYRENAATVLSERCVTVISKPCDAPASQKYACCIILRYSSFEFAKSLHAYPIALLDMIGYLRLATPLCQKKDNINMVYWV
jgi:hypothetical protein